MTDIERLPLGDTAHLERRSALVAADSGRPAKRGTLLHIDSAAQAMDLAKAIAPTSFVPNHLRGKPEEVLACILYGHELGVGPMQALNGIAMIQGRPFLSAQLVSALVRAAGHALDLVEATAERAVVAARRSGQGTARLVEVTADDAARAGWTRNPVYKTDPSAMLVARATTRAARWYFADVLGGLAMEAEADTWVEPPDAPPPAAKGIAERVAERLAQLPEPNTPPPAETVTRDAHVTDAHERVTHTAAPTDVPAPGLTALWTAKATERNLTMTDAVRAASERGIKARNWAEIAGLGDEDRANLWGWVTS